MMQTPTSVEAKLGLGLGLWIPLILLSQQGMVLQNGGVFLNSKDARLDWVEWNQ